MKKEMIKRDFIATIETRAIDETGAKILTGLIPYNSKSENMGGFVEIIANTAFNKTLADGADVKCLYNHDDGLILGRVKNGSLKLENRDTGLYFEVTLSDTTYANDLYENVISGNIDKLSFGFIVIKDTWDYDSVPNVRTLNEVKLVEVSFVTFPAFSETSVSARSLLWAKRGIDFERLEEAIKKADGSSNKIDGSDAEIVVKTIETLTALIKNDEPVKQEEVKPTEEVISIPNDSYYSKLLEAI